MIPWFLEEVATDQDKAPEAHQTKEPLAQTDLNVVMTVGLMLVVYSFITAC
jgi:hypothetical protein